MTELERPLMHAAHWPWTPGPVALGRAGLCWLRRMWQRCLSPRALPRRTPLQREVERLEQRKAQLPWGPYL